MGRRVTTTSPNRTNPGEELMGRGWYSHCDDCDRSPTYDESHKEEHCKCHCHGNAEWKPTISGGVY